MLTLWQRKYQRELVFLEDMQIHVFQILCLSYYALPRNAIIRLLSNWLDGLLDRLVKLDNRLAK